MNNPPQTGTGTTTAKLGLTTGQVVQEFGYDSDVDDDLRFAIEDAVGSELEDEDYGDVADVALIWWREDDGDLVDALVDARTNLDDGGSIILLTPKAGRAGEIPMSEVEEAASTAGLHSSGTINACRDWSATRLVAPKNRR
ncbi:MAG: DUF3052 domain-containing protein [Actinomycetales bacterium]|nr:DUF3052 domain-containing protein [Tetrasphaera sp.]NLX00363.1 DUF3052 domain-containing protein [Actinomycetales bacterium]